MWYTGNPLCRYGIIKGSISLNKCNLKRAVYKMSAHVVNCQCVWHSLFVISSGVGGQIDFVRGAALSLDGLGKPVLAMPSTTNKGESKIVPFIKEGNLYFITRIILMCNGKQCIKIKLTSGQWKICQIMFEVFYWIICFQFLHFVWRVVWLYSQNLEIIIYQQNLHFGWEELFVTGST